MFSAENNQYNDKKQPSTQPNRVKGQSSENDVSVESPRRFSFFGKFNCLIRITRIKPN